MTVLFVENDRKNCFCFFAASCKPLFLKWIAEASGKVEKKRNKRLSSAMILGNETGGGTLEARMSFFDMSLMLLYHMMTVHSLWYAPLHGWLLLISVWAPRAPFTWALLPPFVIWGVEKIAFRTSHFLGMLQYRLSGPEPSTTAKSGNLMEMVSGLTPGQFFSTPGLW